MVFGWFSLQSPSYRPSFSILFEIAKQRGDTDNGSSSNAVTSFREQVVEACSEPAVDRRGEEIAEVELVECSIHPCVPALTHPPRMRRIADSTAKRDHREMIQRTAVLLTERFAKRQIPLAPLAPTIHGPSRHAVLRGLSVAFGAKRTLS